MEGGLFLHSNNRELHNSGPVLHEQERLEKKDGRNGREASLKPASKIEDWITLLEKIHMGHRDNHEVLRRIKESYHKQFVIKAEDIPESVFVLEQRIARSLGHGTVEISDEFRQEKTRQIITDQESSLDRWLDYLISEDAKYPMWTKYWAFTSMVKMGKFEKK